MPYTAVFANFETVFADFKIFFADFETQEGSKRLF